MPSPIIPNVFCLDTMAYVDSREVARDFGIPHETVLQRVAEVRSKLAGEPRHFRKRLAMVDGEEIHSVAVSYIAFVTMPILPSRNNMPVLLAYIRALSKAFDRVSPVRFSFQDMTRGEAH
ncbi:hypothetical protein [Aureimonas sp. D3]|uniref:hypothetical protein n=1 Tax=Aureimonas sp. D3 TaxID=1638164 RepID=UPI000780D047|nr:hypothetical protein [Aureimonas sp. D3]